VKIHHHLIFAFELIRVFERRAVNHAGVVDQHVEAAEALVDFVNQSSPVERPRDVEWTQPKVFGIF